MAGIGPKDISFAELHDAFVIFELLNSEEVGFFERGKSFLAVRNHETDIDGRAAHQHLGRASRPRAIPSAPRASPRSSSSSASFGGGRAGRPGEGPQVWHGGQLRGFGNNVVTTILAKD